MIHRQRGVMTTRFSFLLIGIGIARLIDMLSSLSRCVELFVDLWVARLQLVGAWCQCQTRHFTSRSNPPHADRCQYSPQGWLCCLTLWKLSLDYATPSFKDLEWHKEKKHRHRRRRRSLLQGASAATIGSAAPSIRNARTRGRFHGMVNQPLDVEGGVDTS